MVITAALSEADTKGYDFVTLHIVKVLQLADMFLELLCLLNSVSSMFEANIFRP